MSLIAILIPIVIMFAVLRMIKATVKFIAAITLLMIVVYFMTSARLWI